MIKLDSLGAIQWQNTIGGSQEDWLNSIQQTGDGGYILGGSSISDASGDKTENSQGGEDYWVIKLSPDTLIGINNQYSMNYNELKIVPNPTTGKFQIQDPKSQMVQVFDLLGNLVLTTPKREIDLSGYRPGVYLVKAGEFATKLILTQ